MPDDITEEKPAGSEPKIPEPPKPERHRRKREFKIDKEAVGKYVIDTLEDDLTARQDRIDLRKARYAKLRGWLSGKSFPWPGAANFWLPIMLIYSLKTKSTLENALKSMRPALRAKALQRRNQPKQDRIDQLLDFQFFVENQGEKKIDSFVCNFVDDEAVFTFVPWVRKEENYRDIRVLPALSENIDPLPQLLTLLPQLLPGMDTKRGTKMVDKEGWQWEVEFVDDNKQRRIASVSFYDRDDGRIQAHLGYQTETYDGPVPEILDFEDIVFPIRSGSLQPPGPENPYGAPYVNRICKLSLDSIKRAMADGTYDLLSDEDFELIQAGESATSSGQPEEEPKEQKDEMEGVQSGFAPGSYEDRQVIEHYGRWDADGDGFEEDVIFWVERKTKKVMKVAFLSEMYPGLPIRRPFGSECFVPVPNRILGISLPELLESMQDLMQMLMNQQIDWGTITNVPFFFYRASSGMKPEVIRLEPGEGYPLDDPEHDVHFPQFAQRGEAYTVNTMTLLQQFAERLAMISDVQFGRVPTGKASALRTMGTTISLIAQGDVRSEQVLRRLFHGLAEVYQMMHRLNQRYLPEKKEVRVEGMAEKGQDPYSIVSREDIHASVDFEFKATMLNTNKQVVSQAISEAIALTISPLAVQAGLVSEQEIYELFRAKYKALDLDPDLYIKRPPDYGPKILWEEALSAIIADKTAPVGQPLEALEEHLQKMIEFEQSINFGLLTPQTVPIYKAWKLKIQQMVMKRQMMMQTAAQMSGAGNMNPPGGVPTTMNPAAAQENPPVNSGEFIDGTIGRVQ